MYMDDVIKLTKKRVLKGDYALVKTLGSDTGKPVVGFLYRFKDYDGKYRVALQFQEGYTLTVYPKMRDYYFVGYVDSILDVMRCLENLENEVGGR